MRNYKLFTSAVAALGLTASVAQADYTLYTHGGAGGATGMWNITVAKALSNFTDDAVRVEHIKGSGGRKAVDEYMENTDSTILSISSEYATEYMVNPKWTKYDFNDYVPVLLMNHSAVVYTHNDVDPMTFTSGNIAVHGKAIPDAMGIVLLALGPGKTTQEYLDYIRPGGINAISGMKGPDRRLGILNGEMDFSRAPGNRVNKEDTLMNNIEGPRGGYKPLFNWGVQTDAGVVGDPNPIQRGELFETVFEARWGVAPSGEFYEATRNAANVGNLMDGLIAFSGSVADEAIEDSQSLVSSEEAMAAIDEDMGVYDWYAGVEAEQLWELVIDGLEDRSTAEILAQVYKATGQKAEPRS